MPEADEHARLLANAKAFLAREAALPKKDPWRGKQPGDFSGLVEEAGPCRLGGEHRGPRANGMVYCEHGLSSFRCDRCCGRADRGLLPCDVCGKINKDHTDEDIARCAGAILETREDIEAKILGPGDRIDFYPARRK